MLSADEIRSNLGHFHCTTQYHRVNLISKMICTDGVFWLLQNAEAHWLFDAIASYQPQVNKIPDLRDFQVWILSVGGREHDDNPKHPFLMPEENNRAVLTCWYDTPNEGVKPVVKQAISYSDFPLSEIRLYVESGVLLLPSEH